MIIMPSWCNVFTNSIFYDQCGNEIKYSDSPHPSAKFLISTFLFSLSIMLLGNLWYVGFTLNVDACLPKYYDDIQTGFTIPEWSFKAIFKKMNHLQTRSRLPSMKLSLSMIRLWSCMRYLKTTLGNVFSTYTSRNLHQFLSFYFISNNKVDTK